MTRTTTAALAVGAALTLAACSSHSSSGATPPATVISATSGATAPSASAAAASATAAAPSATAAPTAPATTPAAAVATSAAPTSATAPSIPATVTSPGSKPTATPTTTAAPPTTSVSAVPGGHCLNAQLAVSLKAGSPGAGQIYTTLVFTNTSTTPCTLSGHPGVSYVAGSDGHQVGTSATRDAGTVATITLAPAGTASALLHEANYQSFDQAVCKPVLIEGLRIYPPGGTRSFFVRRPGMQCSATSLPDPALSIGVVKAGSGD